MHLEEHSGEVYTGTSVSRRLQTATMMIKSFSLHIVLIFNGRGRKALNSNLIEFRFKHGNHYMVRHFSGRSRTRQFRSLRLQIGRASDVTTSFISNKPCGDGYEFPQNEGTILIAEVTEGKNVHGD